MTLRLPYYLEAKDVPTPSGWDAVRVEDLYHQLPIGVRREKKTSSATGSVPVVDQSAAGFLGYHDEEPGIKASPTRPVVTFANHTCAMRIMKEPFSVIQNVFPKVGRAGTCDTIYLYYTTNGRNQTEEYKGHHPQWRAGFVPLPPLPTQRKIAAVLAAYDELIENNLRRIEILEEMAQAIYREWFVNFRYPGHEHDTLKDSPLGPIPEIWEIRSIVELAGGDDRAVVGGPFGSRLTRKDYVDDGIPVIRGVNLNGPLGFRLDDFVYVTEGKYEELRGNSAGPGDIVVTQRGTLGQVGIIPLSSPFDRYVVSQSQMRMRPDPQISTPLYVYYTLRSPAVNRRLTDRAMAAGVPHINLSIFRSFDVLSPSLPLVRAFEDLAAPMHKLAEILISANTNLRATRDLLLPRLISGELDVSDLDIDTSWLAA